MSEKDYIEITVTKRVKIGTLKTRRTNLSKKLAEANKQASYWVNEQKRVIKELAEVDAVLSQFPKPEADKGVS